MKKEKPNLPVENDKACPGSSRLEHGQQRQPQLLNQNSFVQNIRRVGGSPSNLSCSNIVNSSSSWSRVRPSSSLRSSNSRQHRLQRRLLLSAAAATSTAAAAGVEFKQQQQPSSQVTKTATRLCSLQIGIFLME